MKQMMRVMRPTVMTMVMVLLRVTMVMVLLRAEVLRVTKTPELLGAFRLNNTIPSPFQFAGQGPRVAVHNSIGNIIVDPHHIVACSPAPLEHHFGGHIRAAAPDTLGI